MNYRDINYTQKNQSLKYVKKCCDIYYPERLQKNKNNEKKM